MFESPTKNFALFLTNRPPIVIFSVCIVALTITTFSFAYYVERSKYLINTDMIFNWKKLNEHFNKLDYCVMTVQNKPNVPQVAPINTIIYVENLEELKNYSSIFGLLTLDGFQSNCIDKIPEYLNIHFTVPNNTVSKSICAQIFGDQRLFPSFESKTCDIEYTSTNKSVGYLTSKKHYFFHDGCGKNLKVELKFNSEVSSNYSTFLTEDDKAKVYINLTLYGYFLVLLIIAILLYAIFGGRHEDDQERLLY